MTLSDIKTLFDFNAWAQDRLMGIVETLSEDQYAKDMGSSHGGVQGTLVHIFASFEMWLARWMGHSPKQLLNTNDIPTLDSAKKQWSESQQKLASFVNGLKEADLTKVISYTTTEGKNYSTPLWQMMQHLVNHATYHRGQIVTMLRQLGVKPANTDMIFYFRQK